MIPSGMKELILEDSKTPGKKRVIGVVTTDGQKIFAKNVIVAAGASTPFLIPKLRDRMWASAMAVFHFEKPNDPKFDPSKFPVYGADTSSTGFYGFPAHPMDGRLKIGNHGVGHRVLEVDTKSLEAVWAKVGKFEEAKFRRFLKEHLPELANAKVLFHRLCCYCDTFDGNFWIDHDPEVEGLVVAAGGSGHGFKFGPVIGKVIVDVLQRKPNKYAPRFAWRKPQEGVKLKEEMRCMDDNNYALKSSLPSSL
jgi:sarcosine oxidase / L-pipecolate oxidase